MSDYIKPETVGLPPVVFLYTLDQVAAMLNMSQNELELTYIWFRGRTTTSRRMHHITAGNIRPAHLEPDWRVTQQEFCRWLRHQKIKVLAHGGL